MRSLSDLMNTPACPPHRRLFCARYLLIAGVMAWYAVAGALAAPVTLTSNGVARAAIFTRPGAPGYVLLAAQELQEHVQKMSGATLPLDTVGNEAAHPGLSRVYVGSSTATTGAGISTGWLALEHYILRTIGTNLYVVGRDGGDDQWFDLTDCQPGTMFGVYHLLGDVLKTRWLWPGELGTFVTNNPTVIVPDLNLTNGPALVQRKYRTPRIGTYLNNVTNYGFGVPVIPTNSVRKTELAMDELRWLRRMRMGTRQEPAFAHYFSQWWSLYGTNEPWLFAELLPGKSQPHPIAIHTKQNVSSSNVWQKRIDEWVAGGAGNRVNVCPTDSRSFCVCTNCLAWNRPAQTPVTVFDSSDARLGDRYARFYAEIANRVKLINSNATVYGYAYDVYRYPPLEATVPSNVALAYIPGAPSDTLLSGIAETEANILGWIAQGCTQMYLRPNWMLSAHAGPEWPTRRVGEHFKTLLNSGNIRGFDSDSTCGSYASFGLYYYLICRLMADPSLTIDAILVEYCSPFGSAAPHVRNYLNYWENFINNQADAGNTEILGYSSCVLAYGSTYTDYAFDGALQILDGAYAALGPAETNALGRLDFLKVACLHGRLTAQAIALVDPLVPLSNNPRAEKAMRSLLAFRNQYAESFAVWREWMIDRESLVPGMEAYWAAILATPDVGNGSNVGALAETNGLVVVEAEHFSANYAGTGAATGITWQVVTSLAGASGSVMQALPNNGVGTDTSTFGPRLDFKVDFQNAGTYYVFLHLPTLPGGDDSVNIGLDGTLVANNLGNTTGSWRWRTTSPTNLGLNITTPGVRTFNVWMREDGAIVDKIILTTNAAFTLPGSDLGPAESLTRGTAEHLLTVIHGSGDGYYGDQTYVPITANAAPTNHVFDRWTGATQHVTSVTSATSLVHMAAQDLTVTATYKLNPALDTDADGILDSWETASFTNLTTAGAATDTDGDGFSDREEFLAGTVPTDAHSHLQVVEITAGANGAVHLQWEAVAGKTYTLLQRTDLLTDAWTPIAVGIPGIAPVCTYSLAFAAPRGYVMVRAE
jgi:hypothetical protein